MLVPRIPYDPELILTKVRGSSKIRTLYILGTTDTGKTSLTRYLLEELNHGSIEGAENPGRESRERWSCLDADPGQSIVGPPATMGLRRGSVIPGTPGPQINKKERTEERTEEGQRQAAAGSTDADLLRFLGTTSPGTNPEAAVDSLNVLTERARDDGESLMVDSSGLAEGAFGAVFQLHSLEVVRPDLIIALEKKDELTPIMEKLERLSFRDFQVMRMSVAPGVEEKTQSRRRKYREERFRQYFSQRGVSSRIVDLSRMKITGEVPDFSDPEKTTGLLSAVCDKDRWILALAVITGIENRGDSDSEDVRLNIISPTYSEKKAGVWEFGRLRLSPDTWEEIQP